MPTPAAEILSKSLLPTWMDSTEIRASIASEIRQRSLFSAKMTSLTYLKSMQRVCAAYADGQINAADARLRLLQTLEGLGFDVSGQGGLKDPSSPRRLNLIIETQRKMAASVARLQAQAPDEREAYPAWRLERYGTRREPREDWPVRWYQAGQAVGWVGACKDQMVALKSSPIWKALGEGAGGFRDTLGNPYPPFAYGSGLEWTDVSADESERLGLGRYQLTEAERVSLAPSDAELRDAMAKTGLTPEDFLMANSEDGSHPKCPECQAFISKEGAPCKRCEELKQAAKAPETKTEAPKATTTQAPEVTPTEEKKGAEDGKPTPPPGGWAKPLEGLVGTWQSLKLEPGYQIKGDTPAKKIPVKEAARRINAKKSESVVNPFGDVIKINSKTYKHITKAGRSEKAKNNRLSDYERMKAAVSNPHEIWEDPNPNRNAKHPRYQSRRTYVQFLAKGEKTSVIYVVEEVVSSKKGNQYILSWHSNPDARDYDRKGILRYKRGGVK